MGGSASQQRAPRSAAPWLSVALYGACSSWAVPSALLFGEGSLGMPLGVWPSPQLAGHPSLPLCEAALGRGRPLSRVSGWERVQGGGIWHPGSGPRLPRSRFSVVADLKQHLRLFLLGLPGLLQPVVGWVRATALNPWPQKYRVGSTGWAGMGQTGTPTMPLTWAPAAPSPWRWSGRRARSAW